MDRTAAWDALSLRIEEPGLFRHSLAVEAIMRQLASTLDMDVDQWGMAGLVHDIDWERVKNNPKEHGLLAAEILENLEFDPTIVFAVKAHNPRHGIPRRRNIDKALYCADAAALFLIAAALKKPDKRIASVDLPFLLDQHADINFAVHADRNQIASCSLLGIGLEDFYALALRAMTEIREELGL